MAADLATGTGARGDGYGDSCDGYGGLGDGNGGRPGWAWVLPGDRRKGLGAVETRAEGGFGRRGEAVWVRDGLWGGSATADRPGGASGGRGEDPGEPGVAF